MKLNGSESIEPQRNKMFSAVNPIINSVHVIQWKDSFERRRTGPTVQ